jgi:hypothetical protein
LTGATKRHAFMATLTTVPTKRRSPERNQAPSRSGLQRYRSRQSSRWPRR